LPFNLIQGIGEYALTIENSTAVVPLSTLAEIEKLLETDVRVIGTKVLTKGGKMQGQVAEILIDEQSGKITGCEISLVTGETAILPAEQVITYGKDVLVVYDTGDQVLEKVKTIPSPAVQAVAAVPEVAVVIPKVAVAIPEVVAEISTESNSSTQPNEDLSKKFDEKHRKFVLGKKSTRRIEADNGDLVVDQGCEITEEVIQKAKAVNKFIELTMSIAP
jgi:sporulation protein YlmC with PRC-barrel domain